MKDINRKRLITSLAALAMLATAILAPLEDIITFFGIYTAYIFIYLHPASTVLTPPHPIPIPT